MKLDFHRKFDKQYKKLQTNQQEKVDKRLMMFRENPAHPLLHNHKLKGDYQGFRSINAGGDLRIIYRRISQERVLVYTVGSHSELYE